MRFTAVIVSALVSLACAQVPVPEGALLAVRNAGVQVIGERVNSLNAALTAAIEAFKPINATCNDKIAANIKTCTSCVQDKCKARAESVCKPEEWQRVLGKTIGFFKDGIPNFFQSTIPDVFVNKIGGGLIDVSNDVGSFFSDTVGSGVVDFGKLIGGKISGIGKGAVDGVVDFGKTIGNGVVDVGKTIGNGVVDVGKKIGSGVSTAIDKIKDFGSSIGKAFGGLFGRREIDHAEFIRSRRNGEPGCGDFENNPESACKFYLNPSYCSSCSLDPNQECPGYKAAVEKINKANTARSWMTKITNKNYNIISMSFNPGAMAGAGFNGVQTTVEIFGKQFSFTVREPINPYIPDKAGKIVAQQALDLFMQ